MRRYIPIEERLRFGVRNEVQRQQKQRDGKKAQRYSTQEHAPIARSPRPSTGFANHPYCPFFHGSTPSNQSVLESRRPASCSSNT